MGYVGKGGKELKVYAETFDLPFHGTGPLNKELFEIDKAVEWMLPEFKRLKASGKKIVALCRSGSANLLLSFAHKYPAYIDGFALNSPQDQAPFSKFDNTRRIYENKFPINFPGFAASQNWSVEVPWLESKDPFQGKKRVVWFGTEDRETSAGARQNWKKYAGKDAVVEVSGGGHDAFSMQDQDLQKTEQAYLQLYELFYSVTRGD